MKSMQRSTVASGDRPDRYTSGCRESAPAPRGIALLDEPLDLVDGHWRLGVFGAPQRHDAKHAVELVDRSPRRIRIVAADRLGIDRGVDVSNQIEDRGQPRGRV